MDLYSLVGEWRVQAERLAAHRSVGSACFHRAELRPAREQYALALALAPGCTGLRRLLDAVVSLGGGRAERAEGALQHSALGAADRRLRRAAFETERARGERALSRGCVESAREGFEAALRYAPEIHRVDPDSGSTLTGSIRDSQSNCWVNWKIMGQPCEFQV